MSTTDELPAKLFRYRSLNTKYALEELKKAVSERKVFLSDALSLNDPFEFSPIYVESSLKDVIEATRGGPNSRYLLSKEKYEEMLGREVTRNEFRVAVKKFRDPVATANIHIATGKKLIEGHQKRSCVACFSEVPDSIPMWAHYSNNHEGYCIEYAFHSQFETVGHLRFPLKVIYGPKRPIVSTIDIGAFSGKYSKHGGCETESMALVDAFFLRKNIDWSYEKEWRVFETEKMLRGYQEVATLEVTSIHLGFRVPDETAQQVRSVVANAVPIKKARVSNNSYSLRFDQT